MPLEYRHIVSGISMDKQFFVCALMMGLAFLCFVTIPKKRNGVYGYKTAFALQNDDTAKEANTYMARTYLMLSAISFAIDLLLNYVIFQITNEVLFVIIFILSPIVMSIVLTEIHLKKIFNKTGERKILNQKS
ncbi:MAG: SdpI family protein [Bacteroidetes bacterium]|nr:SdpI family protein [Bacteroidota bacterium]